MPVRVPCLLVHSLKYGQTYSQAEVKAPQAKTMKGLEVLELL